jgi:hypothetical protein
MSAKTTWSLVLVAAIIFAFIFFVEHPYRKAQSRTPDLHLLPGLNPTNITSVQIQPAGQVDLRVEHTNSSWQMTRPVLDSADQFKVQEFLQKLATLQWQGRITAAELQDRENAQEEFGLEAPQFSILLSEGKHKRHILVGKKMPIGDQVFVQVVGGDGIYVIDSEFLKLIPQNLQNWRDHGVANWSKVQFNTLRTKAGDNSFEVQFNVTNFLWRMMKPLETRADNKKINDLLQKIVGLQITEFVSDDPKVDLDKFGLQTPDLEIILAAGTNEVFALQIGQSPTNNPTQVFAKRRNQKTVFLLPKEPLTSWRLPYRDFRERHLANLPEKAVNHIEIQGDDHFTLTKDAGGIWKIDKNAFAVDTELVQELLARLNICEIEVEKTVVSDFSGYGLTTPSLQYTLSVSDKGSTNRLSADPITKISFGTNNGKIFARRTDETSVYSIKLEDYQFFPRAAWQMRDRRIWSFESTNVSNVLIQQHGQSRQFIRNSKNDWIIAPGSQGIVNSFALEEALHRLGQLKAVFWTARGATNLEKFGFKETDHQISLQVKRGGTMETLDVRLGGMSAFQVPYAAATLNGEVLIFEFPWPLYYDFVVHDLSILPAPSLRTK